MKHHSIISTRLSLLIATAILGSSLSLPNHAFAAGGKAAGGGATTTTTSTSTGGGGGGGSTSTVSEPVSQAGKKGGSSSTTTTTTTTTTPPTTTTTQTLVTAPLTFTAATAIAGVTPQATGSYRVDPYYPTLSLMTVDVSASNINEPDGTYCLVSVTTNSYYGGSSSYFALAFGGGGVSIPIYVVPGSVVTSVTISDASGVPLLTGN